MLSLKEDTFFSASGWTLPFGSSKGDELSLQHFHVTQSSVVSLGDKALANRSLGFYICLLFLFSRFVQPVAHPLQHILPYPHCCCSFQNHPFGSFVYTACLHTPPLPFLLFHGFSLTLTYVCSNWWQMRPKQHPKPTSPLVSLCLLSLLTILSDADWGLQAFVKQVLCSHAMNRVENKSGPWQKHVRGKEKILLCPPLPTQHPQHLTRAMCNYTNCWTMQLTVLAACPGMILICCPLFPQYFVFDFVGPQVLLFDKIINISVST